MLSQDRSREARSFFSQLYAEHGPLMYDHARLYSSDETAAEDIVLDALEKLLTKYEILCKMDRSRLAAYIVFTVRSAAVRRRRRGKAPRGAAGSYPAEAPLPSAEADILMRPVRAETGLRAWEALSEEDQTLLGQKYLLGMGNAELARCRHCTEGAVRSRLFQAKRRLKQALKNGGGACT